MRKLFAFLVAVLLTASVFAQSPEKMSYQAVIRNSSDVLVTNTQIGMEINIRQGSVSGTVVYTETQTPTTNANGLVSIEIGGGTGFNAIDWSAGPYFIETKTAVVPPLTTYTITGTSQLLSVPYALHAKTAESITGTITETDPTYTSSQAANITATDITNLSNLSGVNTGDQDLSSLATKTALGDSTAQVRSEIPDVSGFLTSYTETDPSFTSSQASNITATDITNLSNLSGVNTGDQDLSSLATKTALGDSTAQVRSEIPDVSGFLTSYTETDPSFTSSQAANITASDITNLSNLSGTNTGDQDLSSLATKTALGDSTAQVRSEIPDVSGFLTSYTETDPVFSAWDKDYADLINTPAPADGSETKVTAGTNVTVTGAGTTASPYVVNTTDTLAIGDSYQGGIIFWLDTTGQHGLIAATADQNTGKWYNGTYRYTGTNGDGLYAGKMNTAMIIATQMADNQTGNFAAKVCADYSVTVGGVTYDDWYLPSKYELNLLFLQKTAVGGFGANNGYWSSSEYDNDYAWRQGFTSGYQLYDNKSYAYYVRAVRAF